MSEKGALIAIHFSLFVLQMIGVGLAVGVDSKFSALAPVFGAAQSFFPNPFRASAQ